MELKVALLFGSVREKRKGMRVFKYLTNKLKERNYTVHPIDPMEYEFPLLNLRHFEYAEGKAPKNMEKVAQLLDDADGFLVLTAEYNHSMPPALKNMLDHYHKQYQRKPSAIASYSAGQFGGVRAAVNARVVLATLGTPTIPTLLPFPSIENHFNSAGEPQDSFDDKQVHKFLDEFDWYMKALKAHRER
ncbi:MAG: NADPH-dependent FMN reductase [Bacteroidetes bacterium]|jgi:NAD(P)H-dependent FMN reductase|nr:NADPH-dependent FMN reductase [Bacteroidota bacterium]